MPAMVKLNPSAAKWWVNCPGSAVMQAALPRDTEPKHPVAEEGIALAWATERVARSWAGHVPVISMDTLRGQACPENGVIIDDDMVYGGNVWLETLWSYCHDDIASLEVEVQLSNHHNIPKNSGRADAKIRRGATLIVGDLKYGYKPVPAYENWQLVNYGMAALAKDTTRLELVIVQPRGSSAASPVKTWSLDVQKFLTYCQTMIQAATLARSEAPPLIAGPHCLRCRAAASCPALEAASMWAAEEGHRAINVDLSTPLLAHQLELVDRATKILEARKIGLEGIGIARIRAGEKLPGFEHKQGMSNRQWGHGVDPRGLGLLHNIDLMAAPKPVSPNQAEGRGIPRDVIDHYTVRNTTQATLRRSAPNEARDIFKV